MYDTMPWQFWVPVGVLLWAWFIAWIVREFRASEQRWAERVASDPVVVTGSGHRSNRGPRSCAGVR